MSPTRSLLLCSSSIKLSATTALKLLNKLIVTLNSYRHVLHDVATIEGFKPRYPLIRYSAQSYIIVLSFFNS